MGSLIKPLQLQTLEEETKNILSRTMDEAKSYKATLTRLNNSLEATEQDIDGFVSESAGNTPKANLLEQLTVLETKLKTIDNSKNYIKALLVAKELRYEYVYAITR